jgi:hypothetical protein
VSVVGRISSLNLSCSASAMEKTAAQAILTTSNKRSKLALSHFMLLSVFPV